MARKDAFDSFFSDGDYRELLRRYKLASPSSSLLLPAANHLPQGETDELVRMFEQFQLGEPPADAARREMDRQLAALIADFRPAEMQAKIMEKVPYDVQEHLISIEPRLEPIWRLQFGIHPDAPNQTERTRAAAIRKLVSLLLDIFTVKTIPNPVQNRKAVEYVWSDWSLRYLRGDVRTNRPSLFGYPWKPVDYMAHVPQQVDALGHFVPRVFDNVGAIDLNKIWRESGGEVPLPNKMDQQFAALTVYQIISRLLEYSFERADASPFEYKLFVWVLRDSGIRGAIPHRKYHIYYEFFVKDFLYDKFTLKASDTLTEKQHIILDFWIDRPNWTKWNAMDFLAKHSDRRYALYPTSPRSDNFFLRESILLRPDSSIILTSDMVAPTLEVAGERHLLTNLFDIVYFLPWGKWQLHGEAEYLSAYLSAFVHAIAGTDFPEAAEGAMNTIFDSSLSAVLTAGMFGRIRDFLSSSLTSDIVDTRWNATGKRQLLKELQLRDRFYRRMYPWNTERFVFQNVNRLIKEAPMRLAPSSALLSAAMKELEQKRRHKKTNAILDIG